MLARRYSLCIHRVVSRRHRSTVCVVQRTHNRYSVVMTRTPFQDSLKEVRASGKDWIEMSVDADRVRSHSWLKNMTENGAWGWAGAGRVGPPTPEDFGGLAKLLGTTPEQVAAMVCADFYGVDTGAGYSATVQRLAPTIDELASDDVVLVETLITRLGSD